MSEELVYSTESGDLRKNQNENRKKKQKKKPGMPPGIKKDGIIRVQRENKGRGGKTVSVIYGLPLTGDKLSSMAAMLKKSCGTGGTVKNNSIIIQGDKREVIIQYLQNQGYKVKKAGG